MLKTVLIEALEDHFPRINFFLGGVDIVIATIPPIHQSWEPIVICDDGDEVTVYFGHFTHKHYGYYGESTDPRLIALIVAADVVEDMKLVFDDQLEFYKFWGGGGSRTRGTQGKLSKFIFGNNGVIWSGGVDPS